MPDIEGDYNGNNPNGWGWEDTTRYESFIYRNNGDILASIIRNTDGSTWHGTFMGVSFLEHEDMAQVFRFILTKLVEHRY